MKKEGRHCHGRSRSAKCLAIASVRHSAGARAWVERKRIVSQIQGEGGRGLR